MEKIAKSGVFTWISNSQTLKIKISVVRYPNCVMKIFSESSNDSLFDDTFIRIFRLRSRKYFQLWSYKILIQNLWNTVKIEENCKISSIYMISNTQTLKIKISVVRGYSNFMMKIFSESSNDSLFDDVFIRFFGCLFTNIFVVEVYKFTFKTYQM